MAHLSRTLARPLRCVEADSRRTPTRCHPLGLRRLKLWIGGKLNPVITMRPLHELSLPQARLRAIPLGKIFILLCRFDPPTDLHIASFRGSLYDGRHGHGTDPTGDSEKRAGLTHLSKNFHYLFMLAVLWTADDETVFKNLILGRGRVAEPQEARVLIDCEFNNHRKQRLERMRQIEVANFFDRESHGGF
jgi:hypothetical protein